MFRFGSAEDLPVEDSSVTLITAGRAIQYFDFPKFFRECQRALAPGGIVAFYSSEHIKFVIDDDPAKADKLNKLFTKVRFYYVKSNNSGIYKIKTVYILCNYTIIFSYEKRIQKDSGMVRLESNSENMLISTYHLRK